ncbi:MAG: hypothetical protein K6E50_13265, partial [Lachnospiraceae bacterium]|nr:hypothetical protein [Lachnospiraceae bacterium]
MFKKGMIRFRRKMAALLAAAMLVSSFPVPAQAAGNAEGASGYAAGIGEEPGVAEVIGKPVKASEPGSNDPVVGSVLRELGNGVLSNPVSSNETENWDGSYVYYGKYNGEDATKYRVLDKASEDFGVKGGSILLDCDSVLFSHKFGSSEDWSSSTLKSDINGNGFLTKQGNLSDIERQAISASTKKEKVDKDGNGDGEGDCYHNFLFSELSGEKVFILDAFEVTRPSYGYLYKTDSGNIIKMGKNTDSPYWLRSLTNLTNNTSSIGYVASDVSSSWVADTGISGNELGVRPAFNISLSSVIFSSATPSEIPSDDERVYKLTISDNDLGITAGEITYDSESGYSIPYIITDSSDTSDPTRVSVVVTDGTWTENGWSNGAELKQYSKIADVTEGTLTGTGIFVLDSTITGTWGEDYHVYILAEDINGEKETDYASAPVEITKASSVVSENDVAKYGQFKNLSVIKHSGSVGDDIQIGDKVQYSFDYQPPAGGIVSSYTVFYNKGDMKSSMVDEYGFNETVIIDGNLLFTPFDANYYGDWKAWSIAVNFAESPASIGNDNSIRFYDKAYLEGAKRYTNLGTEYCVADLSDLSFTVDKPEQANADAQGPVINTEAISINKTNVDIADDEAVNISVPITDPSGIAEWHIAVTDGKHIRIRHEFPDTYDPFSESYDAETNTGTTRAYSKSLGDYQILYILANDCAGNETAVYNSAFSGKNQSDFVADDYFSQRIVERYINNRNNGISENLISYTYSVKDKEDIGKAPVFLTDGFTKNGERFAFGENVILYTPIEGSLSKFVIGFGIGGQEGGTYVLEHNGQYEPMLFQADRFGSCFIKYITATDTAGRKSALYNSAVYNTATQAGIAEANYNSVSGANLSSMNWVVGLKDEATGILASNEEFEAGSTSMNVAEQEMSSSSESYRNITDTSVPESYGTGYTDRFFWNIELENFDHQKNNKIKVWVPVPGMKNGSRVLIRHLKHKENANDANDVEFFNPVV